MAACEECNGTGEVECWHCGTADALKCDECGGTGEVDDESDKGK